MRRDMIEKGATVGDMRFADRRRRGLDRKQLQTVELPAIASPGSLIAIENEPTIVGLPDMNQLG